jgi:hypothetical protein
MGLPLTKDILAAEKDEADAKAAAKASEAVMAKQKNEKMVKLLVTAKLADMLQGLGFQDIAQPKVDASAQTTPHILSLNTHPASHLDSFSPSAGMATQTAPSPLSYISNPASHAESFPKSSGASAQTTPNLLSLTPDPASRSDLFSMSTSLPSTTATSQSLRKKKKLKSRKPSKSKPSNQFGSDGSIPVSADDTPHEAPADGELLGGLESVSLAGTVKANQQQAPHGRHFEPVIRKQNSWSATEENALIGIMRRLLPLQEKWNNEKLFDTVTDEMKGMGYPRANNGIRMYWARHLRHRTGLDERWGRRKGTALQTSVIKPEHRLNEKARKDAMKAKKAREVSEPSSDMEPAIHSAPLEPTGSLYESSNIEPAIHSTPLQATFSFEELSGRKPTVHPSTLRVASSPSEARLAERHHSV